MARTVTVNGAWLPESEARISVFDRGFLFADGVYEVTSVLDGKLVDFDGHMARLRRSLGDLDIPAPAGDLELEELHHEIVARNDLAEGMVYLQVTRGAADRDFAWAPGLTPSLILFTQARAIIDSPTARSGIKVITIPDIRWARRDIKTVQLLAPSLGKMEAKRAGKDDAWMVEDGFVTEGTSNNAYLVTRRGRHRHPRPVERHPPWHHPCGCPGAGPGGADAGRRAAVHRRRGQGGGGGVLHFRLRLRHPSRGD